MTGRLTAPLVLASLAVTAILASGCVFVVDHGPDQDATFHYQSNRLNRRFEVWGTGPVTFTDDDRGVARIAPDGFLHIEERRSFRTRRVTVEPDPDGGVQITHTVNGRAQPDDADGRAELAQLFLQTMRRTGIGAQARVGRLLAAGGVDRVFEELAAIESGRAVSQYLTAVLAQGALTTADLEEAADLAARRIDSSGTRADFLIETMSYFLPGGAQEAYFDAVDSMSSSDGRARVLLAVFDHDGLDTATTVTALRSTERIASNGSKTRVLMAAVDHYRADTAVRDAFFGAVDSISSSGDHARALVALVGRGNLDATSMVSLTRSVRTISSSGEKARVLMAAAPGFVNDPAPRDAFFGAAGTISSSGDHARVLIGLLASADLDDASLRLLLRSVGAISSSGERARVLVAAADQARRSPDLREVYRDVADSISSSDERRRALAALRRGDSEV